MVDFNPNISNSSGRIPEDQSNIRSEWTQQIKEFQDKLKTLQQSLSSSPPSTMGFDAVENQFNKMTQFANQHGHLLDMTQQAQIGVTLAEMKSTIGLPNALSGQNLYELQGQVYNLIEDINSQLPPNG